MEENDDVIDLGDDDDIRPIYVLNNTSSNGRGLNSFDHLILLTYMFIGLKLSGIIDWHWLEVTAPLWIPFTFIFGWGIIRSFSKNGRG